MRFVSVVIPTDAPEWPSTVDQSRIGGQGMKQAGAQVAHGQIHDEHVGRRP